MENKTMPAPLKLTYKSRIQLDRQSLIDPWPPASFDSLHANDCRNPSRKTPRLEIHALARAEGRKGSGKRTMRPIYRKQNDLSVTSTNVQYE